MYNRGKGGASMNNYEQATKQVMDYLADKHYCTTILSDTNVCFSTLRQYLMENDISYSPETADEWLHSIESGLCIQRQNSFKNALAHLNDVMADGKISIAHDARRFRSYTALDPYWKKVLDAFLRSLEQSKAQDTIRGYKNSCARFLIYVQDKGISSVSELTYACIIKFYEDDKHHGRWGKSQLNGKIPVLLSYFYEQGSLTFGYTRLFHYLSLGKGCYWDDINSSVHHKIRDAADAAGTVPPQVLVSYRDSLEKCLTENGYSRNMITANIRAIELLLIFLDMNGYPYSPQIALLWFEGCRSHFGKEDFTIRRALLLVAGFHRSGQFDILSIFREVPRAFQLIPEWCKEAAYIYESYKIQEGWAFSTLNMIRSSLCRFCNCLDGIGVRSFWEMNASHIKQFNESDVHKTTAGKNAYNSRIRKFLIFLGEKGYLSNPMLFMALPCTSAPKETVVVVLSETEMEQLDKELYTDGSILSLRKKAMLLLGLKMGIRASDIVKLEYDDINWTTASIRFIQDKTEVEVELPMPTDVGNALFRYITEERGQKEEPRIFLGEKAPHKPVERAACGLALKTALPDRHVAGSGFHVTRKTYATQLLRGGVGAAVVADALGQRGTSSVDRYLSLDTDRMRMCALSLDDCRIGGWDYGK